MSVRRRPGPARARSRQADELAASCYAHRDMSRLRLLVLAALGGCATTSPQEHTVFDTETCFKEHPEKLEPTPAQEDTLARCRALPGVEARDCEPAAIIGPDAAICASMLIPRRSRATLFERSGLPPRVSLDLEPSGPLLWRVTQYHEFGTAERWIDAYDGRWIGSLHVVHGRPYTRRGRALRAELRDAAGDPIDIVGQRWRDSALAEHASIASFARHQLELMSIGAPAWLLAELRRATADEIDHARRSFALAARHLGEPCAVGRLPPGDPPRGELFDVLRGVLLEGCVTETSAAAELEEGLRLCRDPEARAALEVIAADEARHAALAWRTLRWGLPRLSSPRRAALLDLFETPPSDERPTPSPARARLNHHGQLDAAQRAAVARRTWSELVRPAAATLAELAPPARADDRRR